MRLLAVLAALVVGGCSSSTPRRVIENRAPPTGKPTCDVEALASALRARWRVERVDVDCTPGRFPAPGFFVEVTAGARHQVAILDAETLAEVVRFADDPDRPPMVSTIQRASADLDGDGVDEIVETWRDSAHAVRGVGNRVVVRRRTEARTLELVEGPHIGVFHPDLGACLAEAHVEERGLVVHVKRTIGIPPSDCLERGIHRFVLERGAVARARR